MRYPKGFTLLTAFLLTAGCGGGGSSSPAAPTANNMPDTPPASETPTPSQPVAPLSCERDSWVAGTVELCDGALIYRDYIYDDYGADTGVIGISPSNGIDLVNLLSRAGGFGNPQATTSGVETARTFGKCAFAYPLVIGQDISVRSKRLFDDCL